MAIIIIPNRPWEVEKGPWREAAERGRDAQELANLRRLEPTSARDRAQIHCYQAVATDALDGHSNGCEVLCPGFERPMSLGLL